ncbi:MAG: glycosyltransferase family 9 protein [Pseudomonadota bacterium]
MTPAPTILIVKLSAIGDVIHTLPALNAIRRRYPRAHITWLVEPAAADLIVGHEALDRVLVSQRREWAGGIKTGPRAKSLHRIARFVRALRDTRYDMVLDFQALLKGSLWVALARGRRKIGFGPGMAHQEMSWLLLNERIPAISMEVHALERNLIMLEALGIHTRRVEYRLPVGPDNVRWVRQRLAGGGRPVVAINPMAKWPTKLWVPERFAVLADRLVTARGAAVVFTGGPEDRGSVDAIIARMSSPAINLAGETSLKTLAALYASADCLVTTDTGPMHLAAAVALPVVALFGPTAPWRTGPYGRRHRVVRTAAACSPCFKRTCGTCHCMQAITVDDVTAATLDLLDGGVER